MPTIFLFAGVVLAGLIIASSAQVRSLKLRMAAVGGAVLVMLIFFTLASFQYIGEDETGVVSKSVGFKSLPPGKIIATNGEKGPQATILPPGWHPWYWPFIYSIEKTQVIEIEPGTVGMLTASDGLPLPLGATYAPSGSQGLKPRWPKMQNIFSPRATVTKGRKLRY